MVRRLYNVVIISKETDEVLIDEKVIAVSELGALAKAGGNVFDASETWVDTIILCLTTLQPTKLDVKDALRVGEELHKDV